MIVHVYIPGTPVQQGSKKHVGHGVMVESNEKTLKAWRADAIQCIRQAMGSRKFMGAVAINAAFCFARPAGHYGTGKNAATLKASAPHFKASKPDIDKLERALLDALTQAGAYMDDARVVSVTKAKFYAERPGVDLTLVALDAIDIEQEDAA